MEFKEFAVLLFDLAKKEGFSECEVYYTKGEGFKVSVHEGDIDSYSASGSMGLGFRGVYRGRMGYSFTELLDVASAGILVSGARENAEIIETDNEETIYHGGSSYERVEGYSPALAEVGGQARIRLAVEMERAARGLDKRVKSVKHSGVGYYSEEVRIMNSLGLDLGTKSNFVSAVLIPVVSGGEAMYTGMSYRVGRSFHEINAEMLAKEAVDDALAYLGASPVPSGVYKTVLRNEAACDLLETFSGIFSADRAQKGLSRLKGKTGSRMGSEALTIIDDPLLKDGVCSSPFDAEGVAAAKKEVVSEGVLKTLLHNLKTAKKEGLESTGNAFRASYSSPVDISPFNFYIDPSRDSLEEMLGRLGEGLYITELQGLHSGANTISGDFSLAARGFEVGEGRLKGPVEQITLSGNFYRLLESVEAVGGDLKFGMPGSGCFGSPCLLISGLSVAGR